ncbi:hypothetical protein NE237_017885 [Protea cynaroides]|uniref:non-specific serine/threonine protein kinase n=1 Tax=Protea cynaroides TaxID=273540 RepID=A0A9Q0K8Z4_9MAGN|nr:hypothetical protein NE237_017885 [Protea cynaroides]
MQLIQAQDGITCNAAGTVRDINLAFYNIFAKLDRLNFSSFRYLFHLDLSLNSLYGSIPDNIGMLSKLNYLDLSWNSLSCKLPCSLANVTRLRELHVSNNEISGEIPPTIGSIPATIGTLQNLNKIDLSNNRLIGSVPIEIRDLGNLILLNLSHNKLQDSILATMGNLKNLNILDLSNNRFIGSIPIQIGELEQLTLLNLSHNKLYGRIPTQIRKQNSSYMELDLSYNDFEAPLEEWKDTRQKLKNFIIEARAQNGDIFSIWNYDGMIAYSDIMEATEEFDIKYCIGTGGCGSVYIAKLPTGKVVSVKKLHHFEAKEKAYVESFTNEIHVLTRMWHQNIVKLYGFCSHARCKILIYEYIERGSLAYVLGNEA